MQTKVILILTILVLQTLVACTKPKTDNEQETSEITLPDDNLNEGDSSEAAFSFSDKENKATIDSVEMTESELNQELSSKENTKTTTPIIPKKSSPAPVVKEIKAQQEATISVDSTPEIKEQKIKTETVDVPKVEPTPKVEKAPTGVSHDIWDQLLRKYVSASGKVNYKGLKGEKGQLEAYIKLLSENVATSSWSRNERLAYWINVYNAHTVKLILDNYPLKSITDLGKPWDIAFVKLGTKTYTLNQVENEIIRPTFKEPRIHFAVNCAAKSCPPLLNQAFTPEKLNSQLQKQTRAFINSSSNSISADKIELSKIFDWYGKDFGDLSAFIQKYTQVEIAENVEISFQEYDWALNE